MHITYVHISQEVEMKGSGNEPSTNVHLVACSFCSFYLILSSYYFYTKILEVNNDDTLRLREDHVRLRNGRERLLNILSVKMQEALEIKLSYRGVCLYLQLPSFTSP